jgi:hypothetical protein
MQICPTRLRPVLPAFLFLLLALAAPLPVFAEKTDVVILTNGNEITGEIKRMQGGLLDFSTDAMGTVHIEWRYIREVLSRKTQSVETMDGRRLLGSLKSPREGGVLLLETEGGDVELGREQVAAFWPVEQTFRDRADLDVSAGYDYARATEISNFNLAADFHHRAEDRFTDVLARANISRQQSGDDQRRAELGGQHSILFSERRYWNWFAKLETNEALGVDLRAYGGGGIGTYRVRADNSQWRLTGGLLATHEIPDEGDSSTNIEALVNLYYRYVRFADPERSFESSLTAFPSVTDVGRVRADFRTTFKLEFWSDLFWALEVYAHYDSDPISAQAEDLDYGVVTSVGYSF